jgi:hypothetical protein
MNLLPQNGSDRGLLVACRELTGVSVVYQAAEGTPNGVSVESGPGYLGSMSVYGAALSS